MKKTIALLLAVSLLLCGCSELIPAKTTLASDKQRMAATEPVTQPVTQPVTEITTEPVTEPETQPETEPEPVYFNPLNGEILDEPFNRRIFAVSINNLRDACPHASVGAADMYFETFVNGSIIRGLALYTNPMGLEAIGSVRSDRMIFNDIALHYDCIMVHAGGSNKVLKDCATRNLDNFNIDAWAIAQTTSFRSKDRLNRGYGWEHVLFAIGDGIVDYAETSGLRMELNPDLDYNLRFAEDGTPADGVAAENITVTITVNEYKKDTSMIYDPELGKYVYNQYGKQMNDELTGEPEAFENVLILEGEFYYDETYHRVKMFEGGEGWYACGGKAIPIKWGEFDEDSPLWFTTMDGEPLVVGQGNTYVAITQNGSQITGIGSEETV